MNKLDVILNEEDKNLLVHALLNQNYAIEVLASEISDIESGQKVEDVRDYKKLTNLFQRLKDAGI